MRAAVYAGVGQINLADVPEPVAGERDVVVSVTLCGICGSDVSSFAHGSYVEPGQVMGHEVCGRVTEVGGGLEGLTEGDQVAVLPMRSCGSCWYCASGRSHLCGRTAGGSLGYGAAGGFADRVLLRDVHPGKDTFVVPETVPADDLVWAEPVAVAVHAARLLGAVPPEPVLVTGSGSVGLCSTAVLRAWGHEVFVAEPREDRRRAAGLLGAIATSSVEAARAASPSIAGVLDTSGSSAALTAAASVCEPGGQMVLVGLGSAPVPMPGRGVSVQGSFAYTAEDFATAVGLIADGSVRLGRFVTHRYPLPQVGAAIAAAADDAGAVKVVIMPIAREDSP